MKTILTQQEIIESNKSIAEFIDLTPHNMFPDELQAPDNFAWMAINVNINADYQKEYNEFKGFEYLFKFHSSFDWLMPVVEKIESLGFQFDIIGRLLPNSKEKMHFIWLWDDNQEIHIECPEMETKKEAIYIGCIEFIKWYNNKNK
jgi:hypothetical protein